MTVWTRITDLLRGGPVHMTLLDPASIPGHDGADIAVEAAGLGTHAFMVGGSTDVNSENLDDLVREIKERTRLPVIYFPSSGSAFSARVDAVWFMSMLNSRNPRFIIGEQALGAPLLKALAIEAIPMGYLIVEPGMTVGKVSEAELLPRTDAGAELAARYALAAELFGMRAVYLEAGSGAGEPVPVSMVKRVAETISVPLVVGGGLRTHRDARERLDAGARILVTGTVAEQRQFDRLTEVVEAVLEARRGAKGS